MSLIVDYGGGSSPSPPTADILFASDLSHHRSSQSSTEGELSPPLVSSSSSLLDEGSPLDSHGSSHEFSQSHHLLGSPPLSGMSSYASGALCPPYPGEPMCVPYAGHHVSGPDMASPGSRIAGKAGRRRRRSPPSASKFDINDNSLHSVYSFFRNFLSASTASTVAIDNKIEQAMDLVKSHLMFAVREEVDVLKERIGELMERINHLEYENTVLRKYASPEALQQLQHPSANP